MNMSWSVPASAMMSLLMMMRCAARGSSHARRIGFSREVPVLCDRRDELVGCRARVLRGNHTGIRLPVGQRRIDPACREQLIAGADGEDRLAVAVLVLDEFEG